MCTELVKSCCLTYNVYIYNILLKEAASIEEEREGYIDVEVVLIEDLLLKPCLYTGLISVL